MDDGSKDKTVELVNRWKEEKKLNICFLQQANKGKFRTLVDTILRAKGEWFLITDSDDEFVSNTIDVFLNTYHRIPHDIQNQLGGDILLSERLCDK